MNDPNKNILNLNGVAAREIGFSTATGVDFMGSKLKFGLTPRLVNVGLLIFSESLSTVDTSASRLLNRDNQ